MTILVVEDEKVMQTALKEKLGEDGYKVLTASSMKEGLQQLQQNKVDLLLLDLLLGSEEGESGADLVKVAQQDPTIDLDAIQIVVLSSWEDPESLFKDVLPSDRYDYFYKEGTSLDKVVEHIKSKLVKS